MKSYYRSCAKSNLPAGRWALLAALLCGWAALWPAGSVRADDGSQAELPLKRIVMFNSGVGYFEHLAEIDGRVKVDLKFDVDDVNDLLKSMVLQDLGGGRVATVTYGSKDPITKTLQTFAIDLTKNPTLAELLDQIRGEQVDIDAPNRVTGTILGVETRQQKAGEEVVQMNMLNLLTDEGLRSVPLENVGRIKLVNEKLDAELRQALAVLAAGHATDKKTVSLDFQGDGRRHVQVGYVQESPVWKTSYRLVLKEDGGPLLQGWAIVENTTDLDWEDVSLTLVSGRPISFVMDLYQPLYVERPVVVPELYASLRPRTYDQDLVERKREFEALADTASPPAAGPDAAATATGKARREAAAHFLERGQAQTASEFAIALDRGVQSVAQAADVGELFQYVIGAPVTLGRQRSAMLPIVQESVQGEKVSIYNPAVHAKHPLNGLKLKNSTSLHLMQGPITVFDGGAYAGDAQIEDMPPGGERLISYALDLDTEMVPESKGRPEQLVSVKITKGIMHVTRKYARAQEYLIKNSGREDKKILIEYPRDASWTLVTPEEPDETTRDLYRFALKAEPGNPAKFLVEEERVVSQQIAMTNIDDNTIRFFLSARVTSDAVKAALSELVRRKREIEEVVENRTQLAAQIQTISQEQDRIRQNMAQLDRTTDLYQRYVTKFGEQEDAIENLRVQIRQFEADEAAKRKSLDDYLVGLNLD